MGKDHANQLGMKLHKRGKHSPEVPYASVNADNNHELSQFFFRLEELLLAEDRKKDEKTFPLLAKIHKLLEDTNALVK